MSHTVLYQGGPLNGWTREVPTLEPQPVHGYTVGIVGRYVYDEDARRMVWEPKA